MRSHSYSQLNNALYFPTYVKVHELLRLHRRLCAPVPTRYLSPLFAYLTFRDWKREADFTVSLYTRCMPDEKRLAVLGACRWKLSCPLLTSHSGISLEEVRKSVQSYQATNRHSNSRMYAGNIVAEITFTLLFIMQSSA